MRKVTIAIDGPAGSGKSTVAHLIAQRLGLLVLDTGAMYRSVALVADRLGLAEDPNEVSRIADEIEIRFEGSKTFANGEDVTKEIRTLEIGQLASRLSTISEVRRALVSKQKAMAAEGGFVLEGRDVTTVVAVDAEVKIFLTASIEERARRRWLEMKKIDPNTSIQEVVIDVVRRDHRDYTRSDSPLCLAEDAVIVETFELSAEQVAEKISNLVPKSESS